MKTRTTRLICLILSLVMLVGMLPTAYATEETETTQSTETTAVAETTAPTEETTAPTKETTAPAEETTAPTEETTAPTEETTAPTEETTAPTEDLAVEPYSAETTQLDANGLTKLSTPTDLTWGEDFIYGSGHEVTYDVPGMISWKAGELSQTSFKVEIYRKGETDPIFSDENHFVSGLGEWYNTSAFITDVLESGTYYFTVKALGDNVNFSDSDVAVSGEWTYSKPNAKLENCGNLSWSWPEMKWENACDAEYFGGYEVRVFYSPTPEGETSIVHSALGWSCKRPMNVHKVSDSAVQREGVGYYSFQVRILSCDILTYCNSDWSEISPVYNLTSMSQNINAELDSILSGGSSNAEKIQAVQSMDSTELKTAMLADEKTVEKIQQLENTAAGGPADVVVSDQVPAFDSSQVSVTGANLNMRENAGESVSLVIDKPEQEHVLSTMYNNALAVQFSMTLENVPDPDNLQVPVLISLPIPQNINPDFLIILHYHADGSYAQVWPNITYTSSGAYAEFAVTRFSDFVMTQFADEPETTQPMYRLYNPYTLEHLFTSGEWEKDNLPNAGWIYEGVAWEAPTTGTPIYRLYNPYSDGHFYTASEAEIDTLLPLGWQLDGVVTYGADSSGTPIYRLFNPYETKNYHHYTTSQEEIDMLVPLGWILEGVAWYAA